MSETEKIELPPAVFITDENGNTTTEKDAQKGKIYYYNQAVQQLIKAHQAKIHRPVDNKDYTAGVFMAFDA